MPLYIVLALLEKASSVSIVGMEEREFSASSSFIRPVLSVPAMESV